MTLKEIRQKYEKENGSSIPIGDLESRIIVPENENLTNYIKWLEEQLIHTEVVIKEKDLKIALAHMEIALAHDRLTGLYH